MHTLREPETGSEDAFKHAHLGCKTKSGNFGMQPIGHRVDASRKGTSTVMELSSGPNGGLNCGQHFRDHISNRLCEIKGEGPLGRVLPFSKNLRCQPYSMRVAINADIGPVTIFHLPALLAASLW